MMKNLIKKTEMPNLRIVWILFILLTTQVVFGQNVANYTSNNGDTWALQAQSDGKFSIVGTNSGETQTTQFEFSYNGKLQLHRQANRTSGHAGELRLGGARNAVGNSFGNIGFYNYDEHGSNTDFLAAKISAFKADNDAGGLEFQVSKDKTIRTAMTIDQDLKTTMSGGLAVNGDDGLSAKKVTLEHGIVFGHLSGSQLVWDFGFDQYGNLGLSAVDVSAPYGTGGSAITFGQGGSILAKSYIVHSEWEIAHNTDHELEFFHSDFPDKSMTLSQKGIVEAIGFSGDGSQLTNVVATRLDIDEIMGLDRLEIKSTDPKITFKDVEGGALSLVYERIDGEENENGLLEHWIGFQSGSGDWLFKTKYPDGTTILADHVNGKVGIGKDNPEQKLDVNGNVSADKFIGDGSELFGIKIDNLVITNNSHSENLFIGKDAGGALASIGNNAPSVGSGNVAIGSRAGMSIVEPSNSTTTENNVLIGVEVAESLNHGIDNIFIGTGAGLDIKEGSNNIIIGVADDGFGERLDNTLAIGQDDESLIYGEFDNKLVRVNGDLEVTGSITADLNDKDLEGEGGTLFTITNTTMTESGSYVGVNLVNNRNHENAADNWLFGLLDDDFYIGKWADLMTGNAQLRIGNNGNVTMAQGLTVSETVHADELLITDKHAGALIPEGYRAAIDGKFIAEEVTVLNSSQWADFVFEEDYQLEPLESVEAYIQENGHLEHIPTTAEVTEKGINLGEMDARLLRKIEELTLHMIDMNERVKGLEQENAELRKTLAK